MPTIFGRLGDDLYDALCEPNSGNRASAPDAWIGQASAVIGTRVREELAAYLAWVMEGRRTEEGWKRDERNWRRIQPEYHLVLDIKLRPVGVKEQPTPLIVDAAEPLVPSVDRTNRNLLFRQSPAEEMEKRGERPGISAGDDASGDLSAGTDRSPNDDRSDSLNPNNDAYHAAMDNHANQMNPNNPAYGSSRGR